MKALQKELLGIVVSLSFLLLPLEGRACTRFPDISWMAQIERSLGAAIVVPVHLGGSEDVGIYELQIVETIADLNGLSRRTYIAAHPYIDSSEPGWMLDERSLAFWTGRRLAYRQISGLGCMQIQFLKPGSLHVLLLGVAGPYSLEPISDESDPWIEAVRAFHEQGRLSIALDGWSLLASEMRSLLIGECQINVTTYTRQELQECLNQARRQNPLRSTVEVFVELGDEVVIPLFLNPEDITVSSRQLLQSAGLLLFRQERVSLFDLLGQDRS